MTVSEKIVDTFWSPELPVTVKLYSPRGAEELACKVKVLEPFCVGFGEKEPVTPIGKPETANVTALENPYSELTKMGSVVDDPGLIDPYCFANVKVGV